MLCCATQKLPKRQSCRIPWSLMNRLLRFQKVSLIFSFAVTIVAAVIVAVVVVSFLLHLYDHFFIVLDACCCKWESRCDDRACAGFFFSLSSCCIFYHLQNSFLSNMPSLWSALVGVFCSITASNSQANTIQLLAFCGPDSQTARQIIIVSSDWRPNVKWWCKTGMLEPGHGLVCGTK